MRYWFAGPETVHADPTDNYIIRCETSDGDCDSLGEHTNSIIYENTGTSRIGIGLTNPSSKLHVSTWLTLGQSSTLDGLLQLQNYGGTSELATITTNNNGDLVLRAHTSTADIRFQTGDPETTTMHLNQDGNLGIGNTSPNP